MSKKNPPTKHLKALNQKQLDYIKAIGTKELVVSFGPAGTGKSYIAAAMAAQQYRAGKVDQIVLTRPMVPASDYSMGALPGTLEEKVAPWVFPFVKVLEEYLSKGEVDCMIKNEKLEIVPFDVIRGRTFNKSFVVLDECQNVSIREVKAFLTRLGEGSTTILDGDLTQSDLDYETNNGLEYILELLQLQRNTQLREKVALIEFTEADIVRSELCRLWVRAFS